MEAQKEFQEIIPVLSAKEPESVDTSSIVRKTAEKAFVERAANFSVERIVRDIAELQLSLRTTLTELSTKLTAEATKCAEIQQAITIEDARLHKIHEIDTAVASLKGLLEYQGEQKGMFESEMNEGRQAFEGEMERQRQLWRKVGAFPAEQTKTAVMKRG